MFSRVAAVFIFVTTLQSVIAQTPFNFTLPSTSPLISFLPYGDGDPSGGWAIWTSDAGFNTEGGEHATGNVARVSKHQGASFSLSFRGTEIKLYGTSNATYSISLDNQHVSAPSENLLFSASNLKLQQHYVTLTIDAASPGQSLTFYNAEFFTSSPEELHKISYKYDNEVLKYDGDWKSIVVPEASYKETKTSGGSVSLTFSGARAVAANANLNWGHWIMGVTLDGEQLAQTFNLSTMWFVFSTPLFFIDDLDVDKEHTLVLTHEGAGPWASFSISSFDVYSVHSESDRSTSAPTSTPTNMSQSDPGGTSKSNPPSPLSPAIIAAIAIGSIATILLLALAVFCFYSRRRRVQPSRRQRLGPLLDEERWISPPVSSHASSVGSSHISPLPPPPQRSPPATYDTISVPPSVPSTEGGIRPPPRQRTLQGKLSEKRRRAGAVEEPNGNPEVEFPLNGDGMTSPSQTEQRAVERVIAMIAERMDQPVGFIAGPKSAGPPPSYPSDSSRQ